MPTNELVRTSWTSLASSLTRAGHLLERGGQQPYRSLVHCSKDVFAILAEDTTIRFVTPSVHDALGYTPETVLGRRLNQMLSDADLVAHVSLVDAVGGSGGRLRREWTIRHASGEWRTFDAVVTDLRDDPAVGGYVVAAHDVTERKLLEEQLVHQAFHDALTGLPNRALFADRLSHALTRRRGDVSIGVLFVDIDDFKRVNDSLGHEAGDALLVEVARRLRGSLRPSDSPARLGGDEFAVLVEDVESPVVVARVAERVLEALNEPCALGGTTVHARASVGIALSRQGQSAGELLRNADLAMYRAKGAGGFRYTIFEDAMNRAASKRLQFRDELSRAIERDQLDVVFQPVVRLDTTDVVGCEALLRWTHPDTGPIEPTVFVPLAEETGIIHELGRWVVEKALDEAATWRTPQPGVVPFVTVNVSARQLHDRDFVPLVAGLLARPGIDPSCLVFEVTEKTLMADHDVVAERLNALHDVGARVWVDDFGTGFSSLSSLQRLPISALKVPKPFVDAVCAPGESRLALAVVQVAESLQLETIAVGIESPEQRVALLGLGCGLGQGFLFAQPVSAGDLDSYGIVRAEPPSLAA